MMNTKLLLVIIAIVQISSVNSFAYNIPGQCIDLGSLNIKPLTDTSLLGGVWYTMIESTAGPNVESEQTRFIQSQSDSDPNSFTAVEKYTDLLTQKDEEFIFYVTGTSSTEFRYLITVQDPNNNVEKGFDCGCLLLTDKNMIAYCCRNETETTMTEELSLDTKDLSQSLETLVDLLQDYSKKNNIMSSYDYTQLVYRKNL